MKIGILSDTHIPIKAKNLPYQVMNGLEGVDLILHAGDLVHEEVIWLLEEIAPVEAVAGNVDSWELQRQLGLKKTLDLQAFKIGLIHGHGGERGNTVERAVKAFTGVDCIVFGHSHQSYNQLHNGVLLFNPGSSTDKRQEPHYSYGLLYLEEKIKGEIIYF